MTFKTDFNLDESCLKESLGLFFNSHFSLQPEYTAVISLILCCLILAVGLLGNLLVNNFLNKTSFKIAERTGFQTELVKFSI
jgi:hypothetical protein